MCLCRCGSVVNWQENCNRTIQCGRLSQTHSQANGMICRIFLLHNLKLVRQLPCHVMCLGLQVLPKKIKSYYCLTCLIELYLITSVFLCCVIIRINSHVESHFGSGVELRNLFHFGCPSPIQLRIIYFQKNTCTFFFFIDLYPQQSVIHTFCYSLENPCFYLETWWSWLVKIIMKDLLVS